MTNPEAAAPTDMEAALEFAQRCAAAPTWAGPKQANLARCLLASSAEVAALREQVATACRDERRRVIERLRVEVKGYAEAEEAYSEGGAHQSAAAAQLAWKFISAAIRIIEKMPDPGALPKSGAADEREPDDDDDEPNISPVCEDCGEPANGPGDADCVNCDCGAVVCSACCEAFNGESYCRDCATEKRHAAAPSSEPRSGKRVEWDDRHGWMEVDAGRPSALTSMPVCDHDECPRTKCERVPSSEPVERDPDDDSAWPLPEPWMAWSTSVVAGDHIVTVPDSDHGRYGENGFDHGSTWYGTLCNDYPTLLDLIRARNLAARAARTKAAAPKDASHG